MLPKGRFLVRLLMIPALALLGLPLLWGRHSEEVQLPTGFAAADAATGIAVLNGLVERRLETTYSTAYAIPSEPPDHQLVRLTNQERLNSGLPPLKAAPELMNAARFHSEWMAEHDCLAHNCPGEPTWTQRIADAGYTDCIALGENVAAGQSTASAAVQAWMNSTMGHRENMLNPGFREAGGGYASRATTQYRPYWTLDLGARKNVYPVIIDSEAWSTSSLQVNLYVYGSDWATEMRFSNDGVHWSEWETLSTHKAWTLSCPVTSSATVYAEVTNGSTTLQSSDDIHVDVPLSARPDLMVFLSEQGSPETVPASYQMAITCCESWSTNVTEDWIRLNQGAGSGPANVTANLDEGLPTDRGVHYATITVETSQGQANVQVILVVTDGPLDRTHLPLVTRNN